MRKFPQWSSPEIQIMTGQEEMILPFLKQFKMYYEYNYETLMYQLKENNQNIEMLKTSFLDTEITVKSEKWN